VGRLAHDSGGATRDALHGRGISEIELPTSDLQSVLAGVEETDSVREDVFTESGVGLFGEVCARGFHHDVLGEGH
jgi:hypothetical protein